MKKPLRYLAMTVLALMLGGCSLIATYYRHDESKGNVQCSNDKALKHDSVCNATTK